ncbi:DUF1232 domain-containing protein [Wukongibacter baidiensis]|uniref:YkvA family protein n=1 Tax=Wukongibacter baidiensis TaxID=1723361 RepID=UPI003D7FC32C
MYKYLLDKEVRIIKKILVIAMIIYVISPLDLIPEAVLGFGFVDDAMVAIYVITSISKELDKYTSTKEEGKEQEKAKDERGKVINLAEYEARDKVDNEEDEN